MTMNRLRWMLGCMGLLSLALSAQAADPPRLTHDWPSYRGQNEQFADTSSTKLIDDMAQAKLLWESEEKKIGFGKTDTGYGKGGLRNFGNLDPAGIASPIVAGGLVIMSYASPSGEVIDASYKGAMSPQEWDERQHKVRVAADDVVLAIDAATGKTKWKTVFADAGRNPGSGKRNLSGMTPVAADGKVYVVGTCGAVYALDLATGRTLWQTPNWPELVAAKEAALKAAPEGKVNTFTTAAGPTGWLMFADGVLIVPMTTHNRVSAAGRCRGLDRAAGKTLWEAPVHPNSLAPATIAGKVCLVSNRICLEAKTGKILWKQDDKPEYYCPPVFGKELLVSFEPHPQSVALLKAKEGSDHKGQTAFGILAGFSLDGNGAKVKWTLPSQYRRWMLPDSGGFNCIAARDGLIYHLCQYQEKDAAPVENRAVIVRESDGTILASQPTGPGQLPYLWGDRLIVVTDIWHRPRAANAEVWQMYDAADLKPLGKGWHVNGNPPVHVATGGYELSVLEAFADGLAYFRVAGGIRCYDLRK